MPKYVISYDIIKAGLIEVEADDEETAIDTVCAMDGAALLKQANADTVALVNDSVHVEDTTPDG